jgi:hypothetical protein
MTWPEKELYDLAWRRAVRFGLEKSSMTWPGEEL